jgi:hypothetical protein
MSKESARWVSGSDVIPMFPTLVWKVQLETQLQRAMDAKMLTALARMRKTLPPLAPGHGWQSIQTLHTLEKFQDVVFSSVPRCDGFCASSKSTTKRSRSAHAGHSTGHRRRASIAPRHG